MAIEEMRKESSRELSSASVASAITGSDNPRTREHYLQTSTVTHCCYSLSLSSSPSIYLPVSWTFSNLYALLHTSKITNHSCDDRPAQHTQYPLPRLIPTWPNLSSTNILWRSTSGVCPLCYISTWFLIWLSTVTETGESAEPMPGTVPDFAAEPDRPAHQPWLVANLSPYLAPSIQVRHIVYQVLLPLFRYQYS